MNERMNELARQSGIGFLSSVPPDMLDKFAELIVADMHKKVIASILITDVVMEEKGQVPTSEDYIGAINKDFGVKQ